MANDAPQFVHLHLHTEYSLLDGGNRVEQLVERVKALGMDAVAVTDHGNLHGAIEFYTKAKAAGVKPILGIEAYVAPDLDGRPSDRTSREYTGVADGGFHLVLLAENLTGWRHLLKLTSDSYLVGFYYKPRMDKSTLRQWADGLIAINGHLGSSLAHHLQRFVQQKDKSHWKRAIEEAKWHAEVFAPNERGEPRFFIELQRHVPEQEAINPHLIRLARELNLPLVCDNDSHFLTADDWNAHDSLVCISTGKLKEEPNRLRYPTELYVKSPSEMAELFADYGEAWAGAEAMANTVKIAARCNVDLNFSANHAPVVKIERKPIQRTLEGVDDPPIGSTDWFKQFCSQYELLPFDSQKDSDSRDELKRQCDHALRELTEAGAIWRYGPDGITPDIRARIDRELTVLADKNISAYFLIVWDFVNEARRRDIPSTARGSGVGTMVGYCLGLSNACPVHYGLLFERFTDPDRSEYPDIDIDICQDGRAQIIDYVRRKYGHVAQIITFGTLKARAVIRDVARVMNIPLHEADRIAKLIPGDLGMTLDKALEAEPKLKQEYDGSGTIRELIDVGRRLEGMARHASVHAAGVVLATQPLDNIVPLYKAPGSAAKKKGGESNGKPNGNGGTKSSPDSDAETVEVITQWDGPTCEKVGLLKMDFLGLRTLSIIERACRLVRETLDLATQRRTVLGQIGPGPCPGTPREFHVTDAHGGIDAERARAFDPLDVERLTFVDQNVLDLFRRGETGGVFQFESRGMRDTLMGMKPDRLEDLIAANALFRPGPMDLIPEYNDRKHGRSPVPVNHPIVEKHTAETYGVMIYQEQVMQIVHELGGIPLRQAYTLIKAISKKKESVINANRDQFLDGAQGKGMTKAQAEQLFELILKFAGYGFNKSHSTGYAIVAYQTAYLKTYFPVHYMAALLTYESVSTDKVTEYMDECRRVRFPDGRVGVEVRPPDINLSNEDFSVVYGPDEPRDANHGHIRFGLGAVKGVGSKAIAAIIDARTKDGPFTSLFNFCERVPQTLVNKAVVEALIKCGAFDALHGVQQRAAMMAAVESAMSRGAQEAALRSSDDFLFGTLAGDSQPDAAKRNDEPSLPSVLPWDHRETLNQEKSVLGFYVSSHPLDRWRGVLERFGNVTVRDVAELRADIEVTIGGMVGKVHYTMTRAKQERMAIVTFEDRTGPIECVLFPETFRRYDHLIGPDRIVFMQGVVSRRRDEPSIEVRQVIPVEEAEAHLTRAVRIVLRDRDAQGVVRHVNGELSTLRNMLRQSPGNVPVEFEVHEAGRVVLLRAGQIRVKPDQRFPERVSAILQTEHACRLLGPVNLDVAAARAAAADPAAPRLRRVAAEEEACASIDRY